MNRPSKLIYTDSRTTLENSQSDEGAILYRSSLGVPVLWIFAFGGRNIWDPGDDVVRRGGVVGRRNPYETPVEVAIVRLEQVEQSLRAAPHLWPVLAGVPILRRKLLAQSPKGFIRLVAPWLVGLDDKDIERWKSSTSFAENCVNYVGAGQMRQGLEALRQLEPFCPFIPRGDGGDLDRVAKATTVNETEEAMRVAVLTLGTPENRDVYYKAVTKDIAGALTEYRTNAPPPPEPTALPQEKQVDESTQPFFTRLTGFLLRKR